MSDNEPLKVTHLVAGEATGTPSPLRKNTLADFFLSMLKDLPPDMTVAELIQQIKEENL